LLQETLYNTLSRDTFSLLIPSVLRGNISNKYGIANLLINVVFVTESSHIFSYPVTLLCVLQPKNIVQYQIIVKRNIQCASDSCTKPLEK
jgi:hypothetical protein